MTSELPIASSSSGISGNHHHYHHRGGGVNNNNVVIVELHRDDVTCPSFGFNIKGGAETGCPVYIWRVEPGSLADRSGLKSGDEIVQANGISFGGITHAEALKVLKGQTTLTIYIKAPGGSSPAAPPQRRLMPDPQSPLPIPLQSSHMLHHRVEYYTWVDRHGNPVPPPNQVDYPPERLINLDIAPGQNLGLMIRGGCEYGLGIYVTGVDPGSVAERVGLQRGDEILSVNGKNFTRITHDKAVQILKSSKHMQVVACYIGKIPADLNDEDLLKLDGDVGSGGVFDEDVDRCVSIGENDVDVEIEAREVELRAAEESVDDEQVREMERIGDQDLDLDFGRDVGGGNNKRCTTSILQMIEEKARTVLNKSEHSRFTFYRIEYMQGFLPVVAFVRILLELLNTHEKYTLLTEVRELIRPTDLHQFDELIYSKSHTFRLSSAPPQMGLPTVSVSNPIVIPPPPLIPPPPTSYHIQNNNNNGLISTNPMLIMPPQQVLVSQQPPVNSTPLSPNFIHHPQEIGPDEIVDDFIEHHPGMGNVNEVMQPNAFANNGGWRGNQNNLDRQLLITHDPAALTMSHPQILNTSSAAPTLPSSLPLVTSRSAIPCSSSMTTGGTPKLTCTTTTGNIMSTTTTTTSNSNAVMHNPVVGSGGSSVPAVRFKVRISKVKPILGIAIEGGSNTPHRLPRIIDVNPDGSAFHSNLRAGQVLLTVDGKKLDGLTHEEIARLILDCYVDLTKSQIEFLVVEAKQNYYYFNTQQQNI